MPAMVRTGSPFLDSASFALSCYVSSLLSLCWQVHAALT